MNLLSSLHALGPPAYKVIASRNHAGRSALEAKDWKFTVFGRRIELKPPLDWTMDPFDNRSWRYTLHTLQWLDVLFRLHSNGHPPALDQAKRIALDWIRENDPPGPDACPFAWYDMAVGLRAPYLAYLLRAGAAEGRLDEDEAARLLESLRRHGAFLADGANYLFAHNHGLFQDEGLLLLADYLPFLEEARGWHRVAEARFEETLRATVEWDEGVHLEHSPNYHGIILEMVERVRRHVDLGADWLDPLIARMRDAAAWFVMPNGALAHFGDTDPGKTFSKLVSLPREDGLRLFPRSGYAVARRGGSYLAVSAGYHSRTHKHSDELSFVLHESGRTVVGDPGRYGYYETDPARRYARASRAHNVLLVDGEFDWRERYPYGSGILAGGEGAGWFAILGHNPLVRSRRVEHRRLFLYRPGQALLVVDDLRAAEPHAYTRLLHLDPDVEIEPTPQGLQFRSGDAWGTISDAGVPPAAAETVRGRTDPELLGWTFPADRTQVPSWTVRYDTTGAELLLGLSIGFHAVRPPSFHVRREDGGYRVEVDLAEEALALTVTRHGERLEVTRG